MTLIPFSLADRIASEFLDLLSARGINPIRSSQLEHELLSVTALLEIWKNPQLAQGQDEAGILRNAAGVHDFAAKVLSCRNLPEFPQLDDHLKLIAGGTLKTTLSQTVENDPVDDTARKLVELYVACLALHCGTNVRLDHPTSSKGDNPDVLLSFEGETWALAIKTPSSAKKQSLFDNIKSAAKQIERSGADKGLVVISAKNIIDHKALWESSFANLGEAEAGLRAELEKVANEATRDQLQQEVDAVFAGKKTVLPVLFIGQSVVLLPTIASAKTPTPIKMMTACFYDRPGDATGIELAHSLSHWMQEILLGEPGPPPR